MIPITTQWNWKGEGRAPAIASMLPPVNADGIRRPNILKKESSRC